MFKRKPARRSFIQTTQQKMTETLEARQFLAADGFAAGTTGGAGGATVTVTTAADFIANATKTVPLTIQVQGTIDFGAVKVAPNKSIIGLGKTARLVGDLGLYSTSNIIVQNITFTNTANTGEGDDITIKNNTTKVWVDHCTFTNSPDGQLDITNGSDFVTVSWCKFSYTVNSGHDFSMLIGSSDSSTVDAGKLHVTLHDNWWSTLAIERMPSIRFGRVHAYNNYYDATGNNYCIRARLNSEVLIQNNSFEKVKDPYVIYVTTGTTGKISASGNIFVNTTGSHDDGNDTVFTPPYAYTLKPGANVKAAVMAGAGAGNTGTTVDTTAPTSKVNALPVQTPSLSFTVSWTGSDAGSGIANYDVYVSDNAKPYTLWKSATSATSATFTGISYHTYRFYTRARDNAGNLEAAPAMWDAQTSIRLPTAVKVLAAPAASASLFAGEKLISLLDQLI